MFGVFAKTYRMNRVWDVRLWGDGVMGKMRVMGVIITDN
jgi:hypothetical protein